MGTHWDEPPQKERQHERGPLKDHHMEKSSSIPIDGRNAHKATAPMEDTMRTGNMHKENKTKTKNDNVLIITVMHKMLAIIQERNRPSVLNIKC